MSGYNETEPLTITLNEDDPTLNPNDIIFEIVEGDDAVELI